MIERYTRIWRSTFEYGTSSSTWICRFVKLFKFDGRILRMGTKGHIRRFKVNSEIM